MKKLYEKWKLTLKQYFGMRRQKCLFPFGHDYKYEVTEFMAGTGKYIGETEIKVKRRTDWGTCQRCGNMRYLW
jgi:hypothetical protein